MKNSINRVLARTACLLVGHVCYSRPYRRRIRLNITVINSDISNPNSIAEFYSNQIPSLEKPLVNEASVQDRAPLRADPISAWLGLIASLLPKRFRENWLFMRQDWKRSHLLLVLAWVGIISLGVGWQSAAALPRQLRQCPLWVTSGRAPIAAPLAQAFNPDDLKTLARRDAAISVRSDE